jgi:hypothetical protein
MDRWSVDTNKQEHTADALISKHPSLPQLRTGVPALSRPNRGRGGITRERASLLRKRNVRVGIDAEALRNAAIPPIDAGAYEETHYGNPGWGVAGGFTSYPWGNRLSAAAEKCG